MATATDTGYTRLAARLAAQSELGLPADPSGTMVGQIRTQFGSRSFVSVSDVAAAVNVSCRTVLAWREAGLIEGINVGSGDKPYFRISGPSVLRFSEKRSQEL